MDAVTREAIAKLIDPKTLLNVIVVKQPPVRLPWFKVAVSFLALGAGIAYLTKPKRTSPGLFLKVWLCC